MILVDVKVPSIDKVYDFKLNENLPVRAIIEEMAGIIGQKEQSKIVGDIEKLSICDDKRKRILQSEDTLLSAGVETGDTLILV